MIPDTDRAYIAGLFDGEDLYTCEEVLKKRNDTRVNQDIDCQIVYAYQWR